MPSRRARRTGMDSSCISLTSETTSDSEVHGMRGSSIHVNAEDDEEVPESDDAE